MLKPLVIANWKMNPPSWREAKRLFEVTKKAARARNITLVVAPPAIYMRDLAKGRASGKIAFALQSGHYESHGAYTGATSMRQGKEAGASYAIVGHSEVRAQGLSNADTGRQVAAAISLKMRPVLCVGELKRGLSGEHFTFVASQLREGLGGISASKVPQILIAYEPVWAIGGEQAMSPRDMHEMAIFIRKTVVDMHGAKSLGVRVLYGGSVNEENSGQMLRDGDVSGLLVGHVSTDAPRFAALLQSIDGNL